MTPHELVEFFMVEHGSFRRAARAALAGWRRWPQRR
jgi:hypothetical protein